MRYHALCYAVTWLGTAADSVALEEDVMVQSRARATVTLSTQAIHNPADARHCMRLKPTQCLLRVRYGDEIVAQSCAAMRLLEVGKEVYHPSIYFPRADVRGDLRRVEKTTYCPLKGRAGFFD